MSEYWNDAGTCGQKRRCGQPGARGARGARAAGRPGRPRRRGASAARGQGRCVADRLKQPWKRAPWLKEEKS